MLNRVIWKSIDAPVYVGYIYMFSIKRDAWISLLWIAVSSNLKLISAESHYTPFFLPRDLWARE